MIAQRKYTDIAMVPMAVADASMLFSMSSLMAEDRSTMTCPEAILSTVDREIALMAIR
jgi:hypothetical protein